MCLAWRWCQSCEFSRAARFCASQRASLLLPDSPAGARGVRSGRSWPGLCVRGSGLEWFELRKETMRRVSPGGVCASASALEPALPTFTERDLCERLPARASGCSAAAGVAPCHALIGAGGAADGTLLFSASAAGRGASIGGRTLTRPPPWGMHANARGAIK